MIANRYRREGITLGWCPFFVAVVMNGHGSFPGVGAFSVVGHNGVRSSMIILKKLGLLVCFDSSWTAASRVAKLVRRTSAFLMYHLQ